MQRYKADKELNERICDSLDYRLGYFIEKKWADIKVGDIVRVAKDTEFPADLLLIDAPKEIVYVDTMNLDGETNLKEKYPFIQRFNEEVLQGRNISNFSGNIICDPPKDSLDEWDGNINFSINRVLNCK